jgi:integrase/recombinase XerD
MADPDLRALLESWTIHLRAERKAEGTVRLYATGVRAFLAWCDRQGRPAILNRPIVATFIAQLLNDGREAATARARQLALRRFAAWLADEGELPADPLEGLKPPKLDSKVVPVLSDQQVRALLAACQGPALRDRRDEALVRLLTETGLRAGETVALQSRTSTCAPAPCTSAGAKAARDASCRLVPRPPAPWTATCGSAASTAWLTPRRSGSGDQGRGFGYDALHFTLGRRAEAAGIRGFHPHVLRHTAAHRWLAAGGSEGGLMAVAGWARRDMLDRYAAATASERAAAEAKSLNLGDL